MVKIDAASDKIEVIWEITTLFNDQRQFFKNPQKHLGQKTVTVLVLCCGLQGFGTIISHSSPSLL